MIIELPKHEAEKAIEELEKQWLRAGSKALLNALQEAVKTGYPCEAKCCHVVLRSEDEVCKCEASEH